MSEDVERRLRFVRFGLTVIPFLAWAIYTAYMFPFTGWLAVLPATGYAIGAAVPCVIVYYVYKYLITRSR